MSEAAPGPNAGDVVRAALRALDREGGEDDVLRRKVAQAVPLLRCTEEDQRTTVAALILLCGAEEGDRA